MEQILMTRDNLDKLKQDLRLQRRTGIKVKLDFDAPQWWTTGFIEYIETLAPSRKINSAKNAVKSGKVLEVNVIPGVVEGKVQGNRKAPYHVRLYSPLPNPEQLEGLKKRLYERAIYSALLLSGEMPEAVRDIFNDGGVPLMPQDYTRSRLLCSCPEPEDVCEHILAVLLVVTGAFDRDPFLLLKMRGLDKEELLAGLTRARGDGRSRGARQKYDRWDEPADDTGDAETISPQRAESAQTVPMDASFYADEELCDELCELNKKMSDDADDTGTHPPLFDFPLWRGETSFKDSMYPYYESVRRMLRSK